MILTNDHQLPWPVVEAVRRDPYDAGDSTISVTSLIKPPQIRQLELRHDDRITVDVVDRVPALIGSVTHALLERATGREPEQILNRLLELSTGNDDPVVKLRRIRSAILEHLEPPITPGQPIVERRLYYECRGWLVGGKMDLIACKPGSQDYILTDYKGTSTWTYIFGGRKEWEAQLNLYGFLARCHGIHPVGLQVVMWFRDWHASQVGRQSGYPPAPFVPVDIPQWSDSQCRAYVDERVALHQAAADLPDAELPPCTAEERWERGETWAVKKKGNKRAMRGGLCGSRDEAQALLEAQEKPGSFEIEHRPATPNRCLKVCSGAPFCHQWQRDSRNPNNHEGAESA